MGIERQVMGVVWRENSYMNLRERKQEGIFRVKERHHVKVALKHKIGKEINVFFFSFLPLRGFIGCP